VTDLQENSMALTTLDAKPARVVTALQKIIAALLDRR
jgi:hypothetical protein